MKYYSIIFISLLLTNFWGATEINNSILLLILFPFAIFEFFQKGIFTGYVFVVLVGMSLNIISCYYFNGQSFFLTFKAYAIYLYILLYFMLKRINFSTHEIEKALIVLTIIFCISYLLQYLLYPVIIFSGAQVEYGDDIRIRLTGQGISSLGYFLGLNKYLKTKRINYLVISILCFIVIFLMGFRTMLAMIAIFSLVLIIRIHGFNWKLFWYGFLFCCLFIAIIQIPVFADKIDSMLGRQETQILSNPNYVRVLEFLYFTQIHFKSIVEYIFGSGLPYESTAYGNYMDSLNVKGIWWVDWGLLGLSWVAGIPIVIVMIAYSIKAFRLKVASEYYYIGIWFIYLLFSSITTMEFYRIGNFVFQAIALYAVEKANHYYTIQKSIC